MYFCQLLFALMMSLYTTIGYSITSIPHGSYKYVIDTKKDTLTIYNITQQPPAVVGSLKIDKHPNQINIDGEYVYIITSPHDDGSSSVLHIIEVKNRTKPQEVGSIKLPGQQVILGVVKDGQVTIHTKFGDERSTIKYGVTDPAKPTQEDMKGRAESKAATAPK